MDANHLSLGLKGMPSVKYDEMNPPIIFICLVNVLQSELCCSFQARTPATLRQMSTHVAKQGEDVSPEHQEFSQPAEGIPMRSVRTKKHMSRPKNMP
eukprot:s4493_g2.t1